MKTLLRHLGAGVIMVLGAGMAMGLMVWMNNYTQPPKKETKKQTTVVNVAAPKPKPKKRRAKPKRRKPKKMAARPRTPPPRLGSSLSSVSLGGPGQISAMGTSDGSQLLGAESTRSLVMTSDTVDDPPTATRRVPAKYPPQARKKGITGHVSFSLTIGPDGEIVRSRVIESKPAGVFDRVAQDAIRRWTFRPGRYKGKPQTVVVEQTIRFALTRGG